LREHRSLARTANVQLEILGKQGNLFRLARPLATGTAQVKGSSPEVSAKMPGDPGDFTTAAELLKKLARPERFERPTLRFVV
jgi:hypothetical protein